MAIDDTAVIVPGEGHFYIAPYGTAVPTGTSAPSSPFVEVGHTAYDSGFTLSREGGDKTVLPSWQSSSGVRTRIAPVTYTFEFQLLQWDEATMQLYFGGGAIDATTDRFEVPKTPAPQEKALYVRVVDGADVWPLYISRVEIIGSDSIEADPENMMGLSVTATVLDDSAVDYLFTVAGPTTVSP